MSHRLSRLYLHLRVSSRRSGRLGDVSFLRLARELSRTYCASVRQRERSCFRQLLFCVCVQGFWRVSLHAYKPIIPAVKTKQPHGLLFTQKKVLLVSRTFFVCLAVRTRLELATPCVTGMYSNQTELPDHVFFELCFISQKRVQKYAHFLNWQNIFSNICRMIAINVCYIGFTAPKIFFCLPRRVHDFFHQKGGDSVTLGLTVDERINAEVSMCPLLVAAVLARQSRSSVAAMCRLLGDKVVRARFRPIRVLDVWFGRQEAQIDCI